MFPFVELCGFADFDPVTPAVVCVASATPWLRGERSRSGRSLNPLPKRIVLPGLFSVETTEWIRRAFAAVVVREGLVALPPAPWVNPDASIGALVFTPE